MQCHLRGSSTQEAGSSARVRQLQVAVGLVSNDGRGEQGREH
jgi:hypothetical protein